jgi:hypothetical protein
VAGAVASALICECDVLPVLLRKINETLRTQWLGWLREHLDCVAYGRIERSPDAAFHTSGSQSVLVWTSDQVVISVATDAYCGGNHPMTWQEVLIYRPATGEPVEAGAWIADSMDRPLADQPEDPDQGPGLGQLLDQEYEPDNGNPDCKDSIRWSVLFARPVNSSSARRPAATGFACATATTFCPWSRSGASSPPTANASSPPFVLRRMPLRAELRTPVSVTGRSGLP